MHEANKAFYIMSGGMDSTLAAIEAKKSYHWHYPIFFDWGQKARKEELNAVKDICKKLKFDPPTVIEIPIDQWDKSELTQGDHNSIGENKNIMVPERNFAFIAVAGSFARANGGGDLIVGFNSADSGYDAKEDFVNAVNTIFEHENGELKDAQITYIRNTKLKLKAPLLWKDKEYIYRKLQELGFLDDTYSCYVANEACGKCCACLNRMAVEDKKI